MTVFLIFAGQKLNLRKFAGIQIQAKLSLSNLHIFKIKNAAY